MLRLLRVTYASFTASRPVEASSLLRLLFVLMAGALVAVLTVYGLVMYDARLNVSRDVRIAAANLAAAVAHDVDRNVEILDDSLRAAADLWSKPGFQKIDPALRDLVLFSGRSAVQGHGAILVMDAMGKVRAASLPLDQKVELSLADRDYFRVHLANDIGLFVSRPFISRLSGQWTIGLSRRITNPDGSFGGVVVGSIQISYLQSLYRGLDLGAGGSVTLFRTDGIVVTHEPFVEGDVGLSMRSSDGFNRIRSARADSFEGPSPMDGKNRIVSFHRVGRLPLIQDIEVSTEQAYADWWRKAVIIGAIIGFLCASSLSLLLLLHAELTKRIAVEATLAHLAATDGLTGLANRRRFDETLEAEWRRAVRSGSHLSLLMIDADHFKAYNDVYGHPAGDALLKHLSQCIRGSIARPGDLAARYGGEEFAVLLPQTDAGGGAAVADAIRAAVNDLAQPHARSNEGWATVSIGVGSVRPTIGQASETLLAAADAALYSAKAEGRNRTQTQTVEPSIRSIAA